MSRRRALLPTRQATTADVDYDALQLRPGPWMEPFWVVVEHAGERRRNATGTCDVAECIRPIYRGAEPGTRLCHPHSFQWRRDGQSPDIAAWIASSARPVQDRVVARRLNPRGIDFASLPPHVAHEIRFVVGEKITCGEWTANKYARDGLEVLTDVVRSSRATSLLDRRAEDWILLVTQAVDRKSDGANAIALARTFFATLHCALLADPWAEDRWIWKGMFGPLLGAHADLTHGNVLWTDIEQDWLREGIKRLARQRLTTGVVAWSTVITWSAAVRALAPFLTRVGITEPAQLDRDVFLDYLESVRTAGGSKHALQNVNTIGSVLEALRSEGLVPDLGSPVYLRRGENAVTKVRMPKPYPADVIERIDRDIIGDPATDPDIRLMLKFARWAGPRASELLVLPLDCLRHNGKGGYWVEYYMSKPKSWRRFPLPRDLAEELLAQQRTVRATYGADATYMFPSRKRSNVRAGVARPWSLNGFRIRLRNLFEEHGITVSSQTGEIVTGGEVHRYRHTVGTSLLNNEWTQREVQEFLGHASPTMTANYAQILDETLTRKAEEFHAKQAAENPAATDPQAHPVVERMRERFTAVLPNGYCQLPASKPCDFRSNPCLSCAFFDNGGDEFAAVHANHRRQLELLIVDVRHDTGKVALNQATLRALDGAAPATDGGAA